jgi:hypothetical protein
MRHGGCELVGAYGVASHGRTSRATPLDNRIELLGQGRLFV